jgi:hypothetical protein
MRIHTLAPALLLGCATTLNPVGAVHPTEAWCNDDAELLLNRIDGGATPDDPPLLVVGCLEEGRLHGAATLWNDATGQLLHLAVFDHGLPHGPWLDWHENGSLASVGSSLLGDPAGALMTWRPDGSLATVSEWESGRLTGVRKFDESSRLVSTKLFRTIEREPTLVQSELPPVGAPPAPPAADANR